MITLQTSKPNWAERRSLLASFTSTENFFDPEGFDHSVYTRYLVEGIRTGAADLDSDGWISVDELHEYASNRVQVAGSSREARVLSRRGREI
jgi:uncharacterized caspase-like protein